MLGAPQWAFWLRKLFLTSAEQAAIVKQDLKHNNLFIYHTLSSSFCTKQCVFITHKNTHSSPHASRHQQPRQQHPSIWACLAAGRALENCPTVSSEMALLKLLWQRQDINFLIWREIFEELWSWIAPIVILAMGLWKFPTKHHSSPRAFITFPQPT